MNSLSMLSAYTASSVYTPAPTSSVKPNEESSDAKNKLTSASTTGEINDEAIISDEAQALLAKEKGTTKSESAEKGSKELTPEEQQQVSKLRARDAEVRTHEQAHIAAAAGINASAPTYTYETGPDGKKYAVGGEVSISFNKSEDPTQNMAKAEAMKAAAMAPAEPSSQDLSVARHAEVIMAEAKQAMSDEQNNSQDTPDREKKEKPATTTDKPDEVKKKEEKPTFTTDVPDEVKTKEPIITTDKPEEVEDENSTEEPEKVVKTTEKAEA